MHKFAKTLVVGGAAVAWVLGAGTASAGDVAAGQARAAAPAVHDCWTEAVDDARVRIKCNYVSVGEVRGYAVCAGVDSNIATGWITAPKNQYVTITSTYKCRWGIRSHHVEERG